MTIELAAIPAPQSFQNDLRASIARARQAHPETELGAWSVYAFESLSSTMDLAAMIAEQNSASLSDLPHSIAGAIVQGSAERGPAIILSLEQHRGRGRDGRSWHSTSHGGIYATFLFYPQGEPRRLLGYSLGIGLAIARFLQSMGISAGLKWPNDVLVADPRQGQLKKIAGVLIEMSGSESAIGPVAVGIGVNLNQHQFPPEVPGISLAQILGQRVDFHNAVVQFAVHVIGMLQTLEQQGFRGVCAEYNTLSLAKGAMVKAGPAGKEFYAKAGEVMDDGGLKVRTVQGDTETVVYSGEIQIERYGS